MLETSSINITAHHVTPHSLVLTETDHLVLHGVEKHYSTEETESYNSNQILGTENSVLLYANEVMVYANRVGTSLRIRQGKKET